MAPLVQPLPILSAYPKLLDITQVAPNDRAMIWKGQVASIFPGMSVDDMPDVSEGEIQLVRMGAGALWSVRSSETTVRYRPTRSTRSPQISLMLQAEGATSLRQGDRSCEVMQGGISLLDEAEPFVLSGSASSQILFLRMPRLAVASRHPDLMRKMGMAWEAREAGSSLIRAALMNVIAALPHLTDRQCSSALTSVVHMLGVLEPEPQQAAASWRVKAAFDFIELHYSNPELHAEDVARAQRISRRRLDSLLVSCTGRSITAHIRNRRLEQAAHDLRDPRYRDRNVSHIGYANGFSHPAHFARAFKERYDSSPLRFRSGMDV